jgi:hypothetical protein
LVWQIHADGNESWWRVVLVEEGCTVAELRGSPHKLLSVAPSITPLSTPRTSP